MRIGQLAAAADVSVETIRFYEREGLLEEPQRQANGYRSYSAQHLTRLQFIRHCRTLELGLDEVRVLANLLAGPAAGCDRVDLVVEDHLKRVRAKIASLRSLERHLVQLRSQCCQPGDVGACGILDQLSPDRRSFP